jgi:riboflavin kinase/FMN adenylyltransferase
MDIIRDLYTFYASRPTVLTIGSFDGVHRGHQHLIGCVVQRAREINASSALLTLHPHPKSILRPDSNLQLVSTIEERLDWLAALGLDYAIVFPFSLEIAQIRARAFVELLCAHLKMVELVCGADFALGNKREGNVPFLRALGKELGFTVTIVEPQKLDGELASSTHIRDLLVAGEVEKAARFLGRFPILRGIVVPGDRRGRGLGFPTANLQIAERRIIPANGVYAVRVRIGAEWFDGAANVGVRPQFDGGKRLVEVFILDLDRDLYGQEIEVHFVKRLRDEMKFESVDALVAQMRRDVEETRRVLGSAIVGSLGGWVVGSLGG